MKILEQNTVHLSVRELVEFVLRSGDIDNRHSSMPSPEAMLLGTQAHKKIQKSAGASYDAEVPLSYVHDYGNDALISLDGRADGIIHDDHDGHVTIDEIKGVFRDIHALEKPEQVHLAQAEVYAYIYALQEQLPEIDITITYVQLEEEKGKGKKTVIHADEIVRFPFHYTFDDIKEKFLFYVNAYEKWVRFITEHRKERNASLNGLSFPYEYRPGQKRIIGQVYRNLTDGKRLFVQAPTGTGKTLAMLYPSVQAVGRNYADKIFYLTAKSVTGRAAEEAITLMDEKGLAFSFLKITAKEKMCPQEKMECNPIACPFAGGHFDRVNEAVYDLISHEKLITSEKITEYALKHKVCPYEYSLDVSYYVDVIICDYNYAFAPHVYLQRYFAAGTDKEYIFLIDEAHNLADRARDMFSAELVKEDVLLAKKVFEGRKTIVRHIERVNKIMLMLKRECDGLTRFTQDNFPNILLDELMELKDAMYRFFDREPSVPNMDEMLEFYFKVTDFLDTSVYTEEGYMSYAGFADNGDFFIRLFCIDPSGRLRERLDQIASTVFFSATFLPINYYKELLTGDKEDDAVYVDSPFDPKKRALLVCSDVSSKYTRRSGGEYRKIADYLETMMEGAEGNYLAFFPSYKFMEDVAAYLHGAEMTLQTLESPQPIEASERTEAESLTASDQQTGNWLTEASQGVTASPYRILKQKRIMGEEARAAFLSEFTEKKEGTLLGLAVTGGVFSEGIDLKNEALIGTAVVGTGLPQVCTERELIREYYAGIGENGFDYAYRFPGFNKVMQAAGRLIRTDEDTGVILLMDERFLYRENTALFPKEWADFQKVNAANVKAVISEFRAGQAEAMKSEEQSSL